MPRLHVAVLSSEPLGSAWSCVYGNPYFTERRTRHRGGSDASKATPLVRSRVQFETRASESQFDASWGTSVYFISLIFSLKSGKLLVIALNLVKSGFKNNERSPGLCDSAGWVSSCALKICRFSSWAGHMLGLWAPSLVGPCRRRRISVRLSHPCF